MLHIEMRVSRKSELLMQRRPTACGEDKTLGHKRTCGRGFLVRIEKLPGDGLYSNQGLVELGTFVVNRLRRQADVVCYPWKPISAIPLPEYKPKEPRYDRMKLALYYQSLLDSGTVKTRADLARHLGVSRARVTQVLKRLSE